MGATRLSLVIPCALALVLVPAASGATGDLTVSVSRLTVPATIVRGQSVRLGVRYIVRGPTKNRANATVRLMLSRGRSGYRILSLPAHVRPAIWSWSVTDELPTVLAKGTYRAVVTVTLTRSGKAIAPPATRSTSVNVK